MGIDPKLHFCVCGLPWKPGLYHKLIMLLKGDYSWRCPRCGSVMRFRLVHHVVKVEQVEIKGKDKLWRRA